MTAFPPQRPTSTVVDAPTATSLKRKTIFSFLWKLLERVGYHGVQLVLQIILARILAPEDFGVWAILLIAVNVANVLAQAGFNTALIQAKAVDRRDFSTVFWISISVSALLYIVIFVSAPAIQQFFNIPNLEVMLRVISVSLLFSAVNGVYSAFVIRELQMKKLFASTLTASLVSGVSALGFALAGFGVWTFVFQQLIFVAVSLLILALQVGWAPRFEFNGSRALELFSFGWKILASSLLDVAYQGAYTTVIGRAFSTHQLGLYTQGTKFPQIACTIIDTSSRSVLLSTMSRLQHDLTQIKAVTRRAMKSSMAVVAPLMCFLAAAGEAVVLSFFGERWIEAVPFLQIMAFSFIFWPMHSSNLQALNAIGRSGQYLWLEIIKKLIGAVILIVTLVLTHDIYIVALGRVLGGFLSVFVNAFPARKLLNYRYTEQFGDVLPVILLSLAAATVVFPIGLLGWNSWLTFIVQAVIFAILYAAGGLLFRVDALTYLLRTMSRRNERLNP
jgi:teichuronic acid exporter